MSKFRIGDIVKGKEESIYYITNKDMTKARVTGISDGNGIYLKIIEHRTIPSHVGETYECNPKYFELVAPAKQKIIIYRDGASVFAKDITTGNVSEAKCSPSDEFDFMIGAKLSLQRLSETKPKEEFLNGKVVIISSDTPFVENKVGTVYAFKDGMAKNRSGQRLTSNPVHDIEELNGRFGGDVKFAMLIE